MNVEYIVRTTEKNGYDLTDMKKEIPNLVVLADGNHDAMGNFLKAVNYTSEPCVHLEDDIILTSNFYEKINKIISLYPNTVIQFFSMRKDDLTIGTRYDYGRKFIMAQCFYLPKGYGKAIYQFSRTSIRMKEDGAPLDSMVGDFLASRKEKYLIWCPNLVDHIEGVSRIDKRRSSKRQSLTFKKE